MPEHPPRGASVIFSLNSFFSAPFSVFSSQMLNEKLYPAAAHLFPVFSLFFFFVFYSPFPHFVFFCFFSFVSSVAHILKVGIHNKQLRTALSLVFNSVLSKSQISYKSKACEFKMVKLASVSGSFC